MNTYKNMKTFIAALIFFTVSAALAADTVLVFKSSIGGRIVANLTTGKADFNGTKMAVKSVPPTDGASLILNFSPSRETPSYLNHEFRLELYPGSKMRHDNVADVYETYLDRNAGETVLFDLVIEASNCGSLLSKKR